MVKTHRRIGLPMGTYPFAHPSDILKLRIEFSDNRPNKVQEQEKKLLPLDWVARELDGGIVTPTKALMKMSWQDIPVPTVPSVEIGINSIIETLLWVTSQARDQMLPLSCESSTEGTELQIPDPLNNLANIELTTKLKISSEGMDAIQDILTGVMELMIGLKEEIVYGLRVEAQQKLEGRISALKRDVLHKLAENGDFESLQILEQASRHKNWGPVLTHVNPLKKIPFDIFFDFRQLISPLQLKRIAEGRYCPQCRVGQRRRHCKNCACKECMFSIPKTEEYIINCLVSELCRSS